MRAFIAKIESIAAVKAVMTAAFRHAEQAIADGALEVRVLKASKTRDQESHYHALVLDISKQYSHAGRKWQADDMKRLLVDAFKHETFEDEVNFPGFTDLWRQMGATSMGPAIGRDGFVVLGEQTRRFPRKLAAGFITWLLAFCAENNITISDPKLQQQTEVPEHYRSPRNAE